MTGIVFVMGKRLRIILVSFLIVSVGGCVSLETGEDAGIHTPPREMVRQGVYHKVRKGETLWRIAKTYNISVSQITGANKILNATKIKRNQLIFIPGANTVKEVVLDMGSSRYEFVWPLRGKVVKRFHQREGNAVNKGIGIRARVGDEVRAARTGRVVFADYLSGYGHTVILDHMDGLYSVYANNANLSVRLGELVLKNKIISRIGQNRNLAYLHFEIRKNATEENPLYYLP